MNDNWKTIWNKTRVTEKNGNFTIRDLLVLNGFNSSGHDIDDKEFIEFIGYASRQAGLTVDDTVYEIGCGCGAILKMLERYINL